MANEKKLKEKQIVVDEITETVKASNGVVLFEYHGLSVSDMTELRIKLRESGSDVKVFKNTLTRRALNSLDINVDDELVGPKALAFSEDAIAPIKVLTEFAKSNSALKLKVGIIDGMIADQTKLSELSSIPSREGLLTMFAGGLIEHVKNVAVCLHLHAENLEEKN